MTDMHADVGDGRRNGEGTGCVGFLDSPCPAFPYHDLHVSSRLDLYPQQTKFYLRTLLFGTRR